ncbi:UNVERIFIED_ORG: hypothetical protein M2193_008230 [Bradyrhizobium japonicum]|jgi:hypothetical protein
MPRPPKHDELIESIYDAGLHPELWSDVVVMVNAFIGSQACGLISKDPVSKSGATHFYCGVDPHYIQLYSETYARYDPLARLPRYGEVRNIPDLVNFEEYRRGRFYQEWLRPQGYVDVANVVLEQSKSPCPMLLTVIPGREMLNAEQRAHAVAGRARQPGAADQPGDRAKAAASDRAGRCCGPAQCRRHPARCRLQYRPQQSCRKNHSDRG